LVRVVKTVSLRLDALGMLRFCFEKSGADDRALYLIRLGDFGEFCACDDLGWNELGQEQL
jgi:hypothetical protein